MGLQNLGDKQVPARLEVTAGQEEELRRDPKGSCRLTEGVPPGSPRDTPVEQRPPGSPGRAWES